MISFLFDAANQRSEYGSIPSPNNNSNGSRLQAPHVPSEDGSLDGEDVLLQHHHRRRHQPGAVTIDQAIDSIGMNWSWKGVQGRLFCGTALLFMVDSMELSILAVLSKAIDVRMDLYHDDYIAWAGVGGALIGSAAWGPLADAIGRRQVSIMVAQIIMIFGIVTAVLCTQHSDSRDHERFLVQGLLLSRFLVGFGLGGITVPYDLLAEWLPNGNPTRHHSNICFLRRGQILLLVNTFWSIGFLLISILTETDTIFSPQTGQLTGIELWWCTLPAIVATLLYCGHSFHSTSAILESPRFLLAKGRAQEALAVLREAASLNGHDPDELFPVGSTYLYSTEPPAEQAGSFLSLQRIQLSSSLLFTYFGQNFCYRGTADMLVATFDQDQHDQRYQAILSALWEMLGVVLLVNLIDRFGRIPNQVGTYLLAALCCLTLAVWYTLPFLEDGNVLIVLTLFVRLMIFGGGSVTWVSTAEVLHTASRTTGHAVAAGMSGRLGAFVATVTLPRDNISMLALIVFFVSLAIALAAGDIPETLRIEMGRSYNLLGQSERWGRYRAS